MRSQIILLAFLLLLGSLANASWWDASYIYRFPINCTNVASGTPILINGSTGFTLNGNKQTVWTVCGGANLSVYYNNATDYATANDTANVPMAVQAGNETSYLPASVFAGYSTAILMNETSAGLAYDVLGLYNFTSNATTNQTGLFQRAYNFTNASKSTMQIAGNIGLSNDTSRTYSIWLNPSSTAPSTNQTVFASPISTTLVIYRIYLGSGGIQASRVKPGIAENKAPAIPITGGWQRIDVRWNSTDGNMSMFINGTERTSVISTSTGSSAAINRTTIGNSETLNAENYAGQISNFQAIESALSNAVINQTFQNSIGTAGYGMVGILEQGGYISINQEYPTNGLLISNSTININYSVNITSTQNTTVKLFIDDVLNVTNTTTTNKSFSIPITFIDGNHLWYVFAYNTSNAASNVTSSNLTFTIDTPAPTGLVFNNVNNSFFYLNNTFTLNFSTTNFKLCNISINGTSYAMTNISATQCQYNLTNRVGNFTVFGYVEKTTGKSAVSNTYNLYGFNYSTSATNPIYDVSTGEANLTINLTNFDGGISANLVFNGTSYAQTPIYSGNSVTFQQTIIPPSVNGTVQFNITWNVSSSNLNFSFGTFTTVNISQVSIINCTSGTPIMRFFFYDQDNINTSVSSTMDATFFITSTSGNVLTYASNFSTPSPNITICIDLPNTTYTIDSIMQYTAPGYRPLYYYIINQTAYPNSSILTTNLYNLNTTTSFLTQYTVLSGANQPIQNAYVQILRYYPETNQLLTASMAKTDLNGIAVSYIIPNDVNYQYVVIQDSQIIYTSGVAVLPCAGGSTSCATTILISGGVANPYQAFVGAVGVGCWVNQTASIVYCTSNNPSGTGTSLTVKLYVVGAYENTLICTNTINTGSGTVSCPIPAGTQTYYYEGTAEIGSWIDIGRGLINGDIVRKFDSTLGLFGTAFIVVAMGTIGTLGGLGVAVMMATFGLVLSAMIGFLSIGIIPLAGLVLAGLVLAYILRG